ncbi:hypothetical protein K7X08_015712 [Anisodus acutangulus]|uniref:Uncharacterized protein n=1 Tax=Anisodus acutangulus TaxID=402998 RepID=A0A9Q1R0N0_9SOLA|nr:hypothetical protein K7X08_015712 [Anisodus acutangulus]
MIKRLIGKLKTQYLQLIPTYTTPNAPEIVDIIVETPRENYDNVPKDVKEGHFAVFSVNSEENPQRQEGVLEFPCRAEELEKVLATCDIAV